MWIIQQLNNPIAGSTNLYKNKNYFNHNCMNGLCLVVITMALLLPTHSSTLEAESNKIRCSDSMTCTKCTIKPMCVWSLKQQACENKNQYNSSSLIVSRIGECPNFSVEKTYNYNYGDKTKIDVGYTVEITNDLLGFINYLNNVHNMYYGILNAFNETVNITNKNKISCPFYQTKSSVDIQPLIVHFMFIKFNDIIIRFDNVADHYVTVYKHAECTNDEKYKNCATCGWNTNGYSNYLKWCSSEDTCKDHKNVYMVNNSTNKLDEKVAYVTNDCAEINVTVVNPLYGPKTGGTTVTIIVKNHRIFVENRTLKVTVAGTVCTDPKTSRHETITCTTSQVVGTVSGPVLVEYSSTNSVLKIESSQIFQFCHNPVLDLAQKLGGIASGGTSVPIRGRHFVEPCVVSSARMYVNLADGVRRYADSYCDLPVNDTYMVCRSPRVNGGGSNGVDYGVEVMKFNENQSLHVNGTSISYYVQPDPIVDDFVINEDGSVVLNGRNFDNVIPNDVLVQFLNSSAPGVKVVSVQSKHIVCGPRITITPVEVQEILVKIGKSLSYTVENRSPTPIVDPLKFLVPKQPSILADSNKTSCSDLMTCNKCTIKPKCIWSIQQQACKNSTDFMSSGLMVFIIEECPRFSVTKEHYYGESSVTLKYIVKLSNDSVGFRNYLYDIILYNRFPTYCKYPNRRVNTYNETIISCEFYVKKSYFDYNNPSFTFFTFINFNNVMLRFDNVFDHYATFYEKEECVKYDEKYKSCATCAWNTYGYSNYLKWCSSENTCKVHKSLYLKNNATNMLNEKVAYVTNDCAEINVMTVDPLTGPESGGTTVTITVRNHRILADNRTIMVTIAGTLCINPRTAGLETLTCTTSQVVGIPSGPVLVEYSSTEGVLKIESSQIFQFCHNPVLDSNQKLGGIASGGSSVPVHGINFVEHCFSFLARLYVDLADGVRRYADIYCDLPVNDTYMVCRSPRVNGDSWNGDASVEGRPLNFGLDITFGKDNFSSNQSQNIVVRGPDFQFYVHPDPVLTDFIIDGRGSVLVEGLHLHHVQPEDILIQAVDSPSSVCVVVSVTPHSLVCEPTMHATELQVISVTLGTSLLFNVTRRTLSHPDDPFKLPGWFIAFIVMCTVLLFVLALACWLRTKHRYIVTENILNPLEEFTRSQDIHKDTKL